MFPFRITLWLCIKGFLIKHDWNVLSIGTWVIENEIVEYNSSLQATCYLHAMSKKWQFGEKAVELIMSSMFSKLMIKVSRVSRKLQVYID